MIFMILISWAFTISYTKRSTNESSIHIFTSLLHSVPLRVIRKERTPVNSDNFMAYLWVYSIVCYYLSSVWFNHDGYLVKCGCDYTKNSYSIASRVDSVPTLTVTIIVCTHSQALASTGFFLRIFSKARFNRGNLLINSSCPMGKLIQSRK